MSSDEEPSDAPGKAVQDITTKECARHFNVLTHGYDVIYDRTTATNRLQSNHNILLIKIKGDTKRLDAASRTIRAGYGVFFGHSKLSHKRDYLITHNRQGLVPHFNFRSTAIPLPWLAEAQQQDCQNEDCAALCAVDSALEAVRDFLPDWPNPPAINGAFGSVERIVIETDSQWLVESLTRDVWKWEAGGWVGSKNRLVSYAMWFERVHRLIKCFENSRPRTAVNFLLQPPTKIIEAKCLAEIALRAWATGTQTVTNRVILDGLFREEFMRESSTQV